MQIQGAGRLWVDFPSFTESWEMAGQLNMVNTGSGIPQLLGNPVVISGALTVSGGRADILTDVTLDNGTVFVEAGGALVQNGDFQVNGGTLTVATAGQLFTSGTTTIGGATTVVIDGAWQMEGMTTFLGASVIGNGIIFHPGDLTVGFSTLIDPLVSFEASSSTEIADSATLTIGNRGARIARWATFSGPGTLQIEAGSRLETEHMAVVPVTVQNDGELYVADMAGSTQVKEYIQSNSGTLIIEIVINSIRCSVSKL